ncbi:unnamed protein product [Ceutorhynchus assimilis]|uniref:SPEF2 C-terminal domain-containing protein n=1 Tax=Ceutorhynchus assimilis TaxID=467358 RepID=A0A9N9Q9L1_9CUCU|nr:unnamed protein product [Ceutorhynchus assimilis]
MKPNKKAAKIPHKKITEGSSETRNKQVQTPLKFPCEEIIYTHQAQLGKTTQELLDQGEPIGDFLLADIFIEYLKSIPDLKGWALVNYPTNFEQAVMIEEALTGVKLMDSITRKTLEMDVDKEVCSLYGDFDEKRCSKLFSNPIIAKPVQVYDTALTAFIRLKQITKEDFELYDDIDSLDTFYFDVGANYPIYYKELDLNTIRQLAKFIIGDSPLKSCSELFGTATVGVKPTKNADKLKKAQPKQEMTDKTASHAKDRKSKMKNFADKFVQVSSEDEEECELSTVTLIVPEPGQSGWEYCRSGCPDELLNSLATVWETFEDTYTSDLQQVLYLMRLNLNSVEPFVQYVKDCMEQIVDRSVEQETILWKFCSAFNAFDKESRKDEEFKGEMYCRIENFIEKLSEVSDLKMMESEDMRRGLISENWASGQVKEILNNYVTILQIELLRFIESIRLINDYYTGILSGLVTDQNMYKEEIIPKFNEIGVDYINKIFQYTSATIEIVHFENLLLKVLEIIQNSIKLMNDNVTTCIEATKIGKRNSKLIKNITKSRESITKAESEKLIKEWQKAANGETLRIHLQIELVKSRALETIEAFLKPIQKMYHDISNEIRTKYCNEMENITQIYHIFNATVAKEIPLQKEFNFETDLRLYDEIISELPQEIVGFTVEQLSKLSDILLDLSPSGYIKKTNFLFILQDAIIENANIWNKLKISQLKKVVDALFDDLPYVYWKDFIVNNLKIHFPSERELLLTRSALVKSDPNLTELIQGCQFFSTNLWFEYLYLKQNSLRNKEIKKLLYKLYYIKNAGLNYTAMMLDFCKDQNPVEGFAKALALSLGKTICWDFNMGNSFKEKYFESMHQHEEEVRNRNNDLEFLHKEVYEEIGKLVDEIVDDLEGVVIKDYNSSTVDEEISFEKIEEEFSEEFATNDSIEASLESQPASFVDDASLKNQPDNVRTDSTDSTDSIHFLPVEVIETILSNSISWHLLVKDESDSTFCEKAAEIYEKCRNPDFNMSVLCHEYLNSEIFQDLLSLTKKFRAFDPITVVNDVLNEK